MPALAAYVYLLCGVAALVVIVLLCSAPGLSPLTRALLGEEDSG